MTMKKYCLTLTAALAVLTTAAQEEPPRLAALTPAEAAAADSLATLRLRLEPKQIQSTFDTNELIVVDTLPSENDALLVVLYSNNTWKYIRNREVVKDKTVFEKFWDVRDLFPYSDVDMSAMPNSVVIDLVDSTKSYHCPYKGGVHPHGRYGPRGRRQHQGVDLPLKTGDPIYATFCGRVRMSTYNNGGYGNLVIIRHDNGLETYYGHLAERLVQANQWVEAGQIIGLGGSTGRSSGPHLHFETRYYGQAFDPERLIDFKNGMLCRETFFENDEEDTGTPVPDKKEAQYYRIRPGDTLSAIAARHGTTVRTICRLNGIESPSNIRSGKTIRVK